MKLNTRSSKPVIIFLMGPTASGKTTLALELRKKLLVDIISVDSALVYRDMNIGTAKPIYEELLLAPHRLIDIRDPSEFYSVADFCHDALYEITKIISNGRIPLLVGGTMFYFKRLLEGLSIMPSANYQLRLHLEREANCFGWGVLYERLKLIDPIRAIKVHPNDRMRLLRSLEVFLLSGKTLTELVKKSLQPLSAKYQIYQFAIWPCNRDLLYKRIAQRFYNMLKIGFEDEVNFLRMRSDLHCMKASIRSVGYRQMWSYLSGEISYNDMIARAICATCQLAKRQITWLRNWDGLNLLLDDNLLISVDKILRVIEYCFLIIILL